MASFAASAGIILFAMALLGFTPFGDLAPFKWDSYLQYKDYYGYLWDILHGEASIEWSSGKSLGGRMIGLIGYYLSSPLNLLLYFFQKSQIAEFMTLMIVLRIGLAGATSCYYLRARFDLGALPAFAMSLCYALMDYNIAYCANVMWLDGVIMLPLVAVGVYRLATKGRCILLYVSVALAIIANWYTGYMVCLFSIVLFIFEYLIACDFHPLRERRGTLRAVGRYALTMVAGVLTSAVVLLPALLSLVNGKATNSFEGLTGTVHFGFVHFLSAFEINADWNSQDAPVVFCGALLLLCTACYFANGKVPGKEKVATGVVCLFLAASFCFQDLELLWTAYVKSSSYYFRFSFVVPFFMLFMAGRFWSLSRAQGLQKRTVACAAVFILALLFELELEGELSTVDTILALWVVEIVALAFAVYVAIQGTKVWRIAASVVLVGCVVVEMTYNAREGLEEYENYNVSASDFSDYVEGLQAILDELDELSDGAFYRFEKTQNFLTESNSRNVATSESLLFGYNSIELYSSVYDLDVDTILNVLGYSDLASNLSRFLCETYWNSPMLLTDSLLSITYVAMDVETYGYEELELEAESPLSEDVSYYVNTYALPLGYNVATSMGDVEFGDDPFENQESLLAAMLGVDSCDVYAEVEAEFVGFDGDEEVWTLAVTSSGPVYIYVDGGSVFSNFYKTNCSVYVDGEYLCITDARFDTNVILIGDYDGPTQIEVRIVHETGNTSKSVTLYAAQLDIEVFEVAIEQLASGSESDLTIEGNVVSGTYTTDTDATIFLSIAYEDCWTVYVDGEEVEYRQLAGAFIGIDVTAGTHEIVMVYHTPGLTAGGVLSLVGIVLFVGWGLWARLRRTGAPAARKGAHCG